MKLSELVFLKERLPGSFDTTKAVAAIDAVCQELSLLLDGKIDDKYAQEIVFAINDLKSLSSQVAEVSNRCDSVVDVLDQDISEVTKKFFAANYSTEFEYNSPDNIRQVRKLYVPKHAVPVLMSKIGNILDWRYPTLEIGCRDGEFTQHLVAADPLYIADPHQEFLDSAMSQFNEQYQRRIRPYLIKDHDFSMLPINQFGFVFSWNHFNYMSLDTIRDHLQQIFDLLRPGGRALFSYNNGDLPDAAGYAERYYMTYIPKSMLVPLCEMLGFEIVDSQDFVPAVSWLEIRKPGELRTVKAHQVLGEIIEKAQ